MNPDFSQAAGYFASVCVLATFSMRSMIPLRILAILSNFAFLAYGIPQRLWPVIVLHTILLPLNLARLREALRWRETVSARERLETSSGQRAAM